MSVFTTAGCRVRQALHRAAARSRRTVRPSVQAGAGAVFSTAQILRSHRLKKPLVVIGREGAPWAERLIHTLEESDIDFARYGTLGEEPTVEDGEKLRMAWVQEICDCFIVLGNERDIDLVKAASARAVCLNRTIPELAGVNRVRRRTPPVIAIPTAAGSGTESLDRAVVYDGQGAFVIEDTSLVPAFVVLDPELLEHVSRPALARAVMEGVCLAVEAYLSGYGDEVTRGLAAEALAGFFAAAEPCWNSGGTTEQRGRLMTASQMAGEAASAAGGGYARALSAGASRVCGISYGEACAVMLPAVLEKYGNRVREPLAELALRSGAAEDGPRAEQAAALIARVRQLAFRLGLPETADALSPEAALRIADLAAAGANPRYACPVVWTAADLAAVVRAACAVREV